MPQSGAADAALHNMHWRLGILCDFQAYFWLQVFSAKEKGDANLSK